MNRIHHLFKNKTKDILSIFFTAGFPALEDTREILINLQKSGADLIEIGMPYSDPIADGQTIQQSSMKALENGMSIEILFQQLEGIRQVVDIPLILMGYLNPVIQYGLKKFVKKATEVGIDGFILPDLPMYEYENEYKTLFDQHQLSNIFLITPQTSEERIKKIDEISDAFIYMVSMDSTTGRVGEFTEQQLSYFDRISGMDLDNPRLIGFGISDKKSFDAASEHANGAIIGSAFIKALAKDGEASIAEKVGTFINQIREGSSALSHG
ncbi:MAG: tryptophan synthase subunit alpha [Bacteroidia bacterium]|nr:tryptophan synthase subunit alpha [Bacteroidia bacterium]